ncbi:MAG TPA: CPBP family intramembrane glutamic endopeptidase, partial [Candidatus Binatia bacterium]|nr:CPBP family intramembrane glutamic endopeptidase [Candidatus Binatia bacterium]
IVLVLFPGLYVIEGQFFITIITIFEYLLPGSLLNAYSRPGFVLHWVIVLGLHWIGVLVVVFFLRQGGATVSTIGLGTPTTQVSAVFGILLLLGVGFLVFRVYSSHGDILTPIGAKLPLQYVSTTFERGCWIAISLSAGFCEELVYRGFGIAALKHLGVPLWGAIIASSISFMFIHGIGPIPLMAGPFVGGIGFAIIYVVSKGLLPVMVIHAGSDLLAILVQ